MKRLGLLGVVTLLAGCTEKNPAYCDRDGDCLLSGICDKTAHTCAVTPGDGGPDGPLTHCMGDPNCPSSQPHCLEGICRQCVVSLDCAGGLICLPDHSCGMCSQDSECAFAGGLCAHGMCPPASNVAWADCNSMICPGDGSQTAPFCSLRDATDQGRPFVVMKRGTCYSGVRIQSHTEEIFGNGSEVRAPSGESGISAEGSSANVVVHDLSITTLAGDAPSGAQVVDGQLRLENVIVHEMLGSTSSGVLAQNGTLTLRKCLIYLNHGWGVQVADSNYRIENTFVLANGSSTNTNQGSGGVRLTGNSPGVFVYNTVARNLFPTPGGTPNGAGVSCERSATLYASLLIENQNIMLQDTQGMCTLMSSVTTTTALPLLGNDIFADPSRPQDCTTNRMGFHVKTTAFSVVHKSALQPSTVTMNQDDYDGEQRPSLTTPGADEPVP